MRRLALAIFIAVVLSGCANRMPLACLWSGSCSQEVVTDQNGVPYKNRLGTVQKVTVKESKANGMTGDLATAIDSFSEVRVEELKLDRAKIENKTGGVQFKLLSGSEIKEFAGGGEAAYFQSLDQYNLMKFAETALVTMGEAMRAMADAGKDSDVVGMTKAWMNGVAAVSQDGVEKISAFMNPLQRVGISVVAGKAYKSQQNATRDIGIAAAQTGNSYTVGDITTSASQGSSADSNDGELASSAGSGGTGGELTGGGAGGASSGSASGSGTSSNTRDGSTNTIITIGNENVTGVASDSARSFVDTQSTQQLEQSATGAANDDVNIDQQPVIDDNQGDQLNQPENGSNNDADFL